MCGMLVFIQHVWNPLCKDLHFPSCYWESETCLLGIFPLLLQSLHTPCCCLPQAWHERHTSLLCRRRRHATEVHLCILPPFTSEQFCTMGMSAKPLIQGRMTRFSKQDVKFHHSTNVCKKLPCKFLANKLNSKWRSKQMTASYHSLYWLPCDTVIQESCEITGYLNGRVWDACWG
jgi:hypothetical protein